MRIMEMGGGEGKEPDEKDIGKGGKRMSKWFGGTYTNGLGGSAREERW